MPRGRRRRAREDDQRGPAGAGRRGAGRCRGARPAGPCHVHLATAPPATRRRSTSGWRRRRDSTRLESRVTVEVAGPARPAAPRAADHRPRVLLVTGFGRSGTTLVNTILGSTPGRLRGRRDPLPVGAGADRAASLRLRPAPSSRARSGARCSRRRSATRSTLDAGGAGGRGRAGDAHAAPAADARRRASVGDRLIRRLDAPARRAHGGVPLASRRSPAPGSSWTRRSPRRSATCSQHLDGIDLRVLHVVRDPRAVAYSWTRSKRADRRRGPTRDAAARRRPQSALQWDLWNGAAERDVARLGPLPAGALRGPRRRPPRRGWAGSLSFAGVADWWPCRSRSPHEVAAATVHTVAGNADRMRSGPLRDLALDDAWQRELPARARRLVTALTCPLAVRYRYGSATLHRSTRPSTD